VFPIDTARREASIWGVARDLTERSSAHRRYGCYGRLGEILGRVVRGQTIGDPGEAMKIRLLLAFVALVISIAAPTFAQEQEVVDPAIRQQLLALDKKFDDAMSNNDATAVAALFGQDAVDVTPIGVSSGRQAIEKYFEGIFQRWHLSEHISRLEHVYEFGSHLCVTGEWAVKATTQPLGGYRTLIYDRDGDSWKIGVRVLVY
jgi:ketosteroid isomerase-like protein